MITILCKAQCCLKFTNRVFQIQLYENKRKRLDNSLKCNVLAVVHNILIKLAKTKRLWFLEQYQ